MADNCGVFHNCHCVTISSIVSLLYTLKYFSNGCLPYRSVHMVTSNTGILLNCLHRSSARLKVQRSWILGSAEIKIANIFSNRNIRTTAKIEPREKYPLYGNTPKSTRPVVRCTISALVCTSCTRGVQENAAISLVVLQTAEILGLIICFAIHFLCLIIE